MVSENYELQDKSRIGVIGGGPAGSFFAYFAKYFAKLIDLDIEVDIYEPKLFSTPGPAGCNHCGGIISESLIQMLATEGINLPSTVIRRGIESYTLHIEDKKVIIATPNHEQRIAAVYRGFGPKGTKNDQQESFDGYLINKCRERGVNIINDKVIDIIRESSGLTAQAKSGDKINYDLLVGSAGLNMHTLKMFKEIQPEYVEPETTKTHICEFHLEPEIIDKYFSHSMHVFLVDIPHVKFGALIPKGHFVTLVLLGDKIDKHIVDQFLTSKAVVSCFPPDQPPKSLVMCQCYPQINIKGARNVFSDNMILVGDSASSKLFKNGIGAAYTTAKAAAKTAIFEGVSKQHFNQYYQPCCDELNRDNGYGKLIFDVTKLVQKVGFLKETLYKTVRREQNWPSNERRLSSILWDTFTGSASYQDIFNRGIHPKVTYEYIKSSFAKI